MMDNSYLHKYPWRSLCWFFLSFLILLLLMEGYRHLTKPDVSQKEEIIANSLDEAAAIFQNSQQELLNETEELADDLRHEGLQDSLMDVYEILENHTSLWGSVLVKNGDPVVWTGYSLAILQQAEWKKDSKNYVEIKKQNNALFWLAHVVFSTEAQSKTSSYHLYTAKRISQATALQIGSEQEYHILNNANRSYDYPLAISIFKPAPKQNINYRVLTNTAQDSIGVVYAVSGHFQQLLQKWTEANNRRRSLFTIFFFIALLFFVTFLIELKSIWANLLVRLIMIFTGWWFFSYLSISNRWLPDLLEGQPSEMIASYQLLLSFSINAIFLFLIAYSIHYTLRKSLTRRRVLGYFPSVTGGFTAGAASAAAIAFAFSYIYSLIVHSSFSLLSLQIIPPAGVFLLYLGLGIMLWAVVLLVLNINRFTFRVCRDYNRAAFIASLIGFIICFFAFNIINKSILFDWQLFTALFFYGMICTLSFIYYRRPLITQHLSTLRTVAAVTFILAIAGTAFIYYGQLRNQDEMLMEVARDFKKDDIIARRLTADLLSRLHLGLQALTLNDLKNRKPFIKPSFTEVIQSAVKEDRTPYSFHFQLVTSEGERIAEFSNDLNTPEWLEYFDPSQFSITARIQGINKNYTKPIIQQPELVNQQKYETFYRGWVPLYNPSRDRPMAWIVGSVYQKRFDFRKPMQAVLASFRYENWNKPVIIQQYKNGRLLSTVSLGISSYFPVYNKLPKKITAFKGDTLIYYNSGNEQYSYRNLMVEKFDDSIIKVSTIAPDIHNILFTFFQFQLTLILVGFAASLFLQWINKGKIVLINQNIQFRYKILDSFLLATLAFLILMIAGTYYTLYRQNRDLVKLQLFKDLQSVELQSNTLASFQKDGESYFDSLLQFVITQINTDASFYVDKKLIASTTPQVYRQHLLPASLPFPVYNTLFEDQKRSAIHSITLFGQPLFVGYRLLYTEENEPLAAIAIPTYVQSPKFKRRLLEISSFLVLLYVLVFGIFIVGTIFISQKLTEPLYEIRRGLNRIAMGNLGTSIPIKSKDEIGILAATYNRMARQLKKLQAELAKSEREAAWKEIAQEAAHEIKNPLTPMKLNIQHLRRQASSNNATKKELKSKIIQVTKNMLTQIDSLNTIAYNFLSYSSSKDLDFEPVNMQELVMRIVELHENIGDKKLEVNLSGQSAIVRGAEDELYSAVFNLVKNAYDATPNGGVVKISTYTSNGYFYVQVHNRGEVIPENIQKDIFTPNFSTKLDGTGLGLTICKKAVTAHNGDIIFKSNNEEGTTFTIRLPLKS